MRRCIGLDVHREFAQVAIWERGQVRQAGQIATTPEALRLFADSLCEHDEVAIEATCNTYAIARLLEERVARVVVSNPQKTRAIAEAKVKTDKVDAAVLAELLAADYLPGVWLPDEETHALRRQVARRAHIVRQRTRLKNRVQSILHRNLVPRSPAADLFGRKGRAWLAEQPLPADVRQSGGQPASHGRISKQGRAHARGMLVEAAWVAAKTPGPLRAFYERVRARRGMQIAVVATARKLAVLCWHLIVKDEDYAYQRPSLTAQKLRALELRAGMPSRRGQRGSTHAYNLKEVRARERALSEQAERAYRQLVADWQAKAPTSGAGVAAATGARLSRPAVGPAARQDSTPTPALRSGVGHAHTEA